MAGGPVRTEDGFSAWWASAGTGCDIGLINIPGLSSEQVQCLLNLIDGPTGGYKKLSGNVSWMLDSGASTHMKGDVTFI